MNKQCSSSRCGEFKPINQFYRNKRMVDGRSEVCISCTKVYVGRKRPQQKQKYTTTTNKAGQMRGSILDVIRLRFKSWCIRGGGFK